MSDAATTPTPPPLSYASPDRVGLRIWLYRVAQFCWLAPLVVGLGTLALFGLTFWDQLPPFGLFVLVGGAFLLAVGLACIVPFYLDARRSEPATRGVWLPRAKRMATLLLSNVLVALGCMFTGTWLMSFYPVTLFNSTTTPITDITLNVTGEVVKVEDLGPGEKRRVLVTPRREGSITFSAAQDGNVVTGEAAGYVSSGIGGKSEVTFTGTGPAIVSNR